MEEPILLFLHGVGSGDLDDAWSTALSASLQSIGYPGLDDVRCVAPKYPNTLLYPADERVHLPEITVKAARGADAEVQRREFERRVGAMEVRLGRHVAGSPLPGAQIPVDAGFLAPGFKAARNYVKNKQTRARVLSKVLNALPKQGRLMIVGHSLGSVIAADLIRRLPAGLEVAGLITIGSPIAHEKFGLEGLHDNLKIPPTNLAWWVNFWNGSDVVTSHRGISSKLPWVLDMRVPLTPNPVAAHSATRYLLNPAVAHAVGFGLFGSRVKELARVSNVLEIAPDYAEQVALLALRYAHLVSHHLDGSRKERFTEALREIQATAVESIEQRNASLVPERPLPSAVALLRTNRDNAEEPIPEPVVITHLSKAEAVLPLISIVNANVTAPYEITIPRAVRRKAFAQLTSDMGLGTKFGVEILAAADEAEDVLKPGADWFRIALFGLGAVAMLAGTGGLALAAAPGVAGAAAVTSALAAFGPGGMIGGLLTAGTLVTAGGGGIAYSLASPDTSAEAVEATVTAQLSAAIVRHREGLDQDASVWDGLMQTEIAVRRQLSRLEAISDENSSGVKTLRRKLATVEGAMKHLLESGIGMQGQSDTEVDELL